ncbi:MAG: penicillin acylase family protein [Chroococcidiopsidaceae cyanobacterium CP_BM_ER_R8_30]|nr:penicillin acylase family protein [Chroococcidiopsidaceae cyanobacterium CP_BM_ER_R8_30]
MPNVRKDSDSHPWGWRYPVPGWTNAFEWKGYIPFEQLPFAFNPTQGYIATANNAMVGSDYPYLITSEWDYGYRAQRVVDMIKQKMHLINFTDIKQMQGDNKHLNTEVMIPILLQIPLNNNHLESIRGLLQD